MPVETRPFVAIIGGFRMLQEPATTQAKKTAREIGEALATAGMGLVVYFSDEVSLEPHVVSGFVEALPAGSGDRSIRVRFADSQRDTVRFKEQDTRPELFDLKIFASNDWEAPFYRSLVNADGVDAVLLMAGAQSVLIAGQIALGRPLPVLAIDKFEGSAKAIRTELAINATDYPSSATHSPAQLVTWLREKCEARAKERAEAVRREKKFLKATSQFQKTLWTSVAFVGLLIALFFGMAREPSPNSYVYVTLAGWIAAGATGAMIRSIIWGTDEDSPIISLTLGGVAGLVVGMAYIIPQWIAAGEILMPTPKTVGATDKIQFVSSVLVALSAGVGFDTVFTRLKKQAEEQPIGAPRQGAH